MNACAVSNTSVGLYVAVTIWSEGRFRQRNPKKTYFCPALDPTPGISGRNRYQNGSIPGIIAHVASEI